MFPDNNEKTFDCESIFLMFMSNTCIKVEITAEFPSEEDKRRRKRDVNGESDAARIEK